MASPLTRASTSGSCAGTGFGGAGVSAVAPGAAAALPSLLRPSASSAPFGEVPLHPTKPTAAVKASTGSSNLARDICLEYDVLRAILNVLFGLRGTRRLDAFRATPARIGSSVGRACDCKT